VTVTYLANCSIRLTISRHGLHSFLSFYRTVTIPTCETVATYTGDCYPLTPRRLRKSFWRRSRSSPKRQISWNQRFLMSWSVTSPAWRPSTTSRRMHLWKAEAVYQHDAFYRRGLMSLFLYADISSIQLKHTTRAIYLSEWVALLFLLLHPVLFSGGGH